MERRILHPARYRAIAVIQGSRRRGGCARRARWPVRDSHPDAFLPGCWEEAASLVLPEHRLATNTAMRMLDLSVKSQVATQGVVPSEESASTRLYNANRRVAFANRYGTDDGTSTRSAGFGNERWAGVACATRTLEAPKVLMRSHSATAHSSSKGWTAPSRSGCKLA